MIDDHKTGQQLVDELAELRRRVAELETAEIGRRRAEEGLRRANRALKMLSECNQAAVRATDEARLLHDVCHIIVEVGGYRLAWVGLAGHDEGKTVRPVAQAGYEEGYLDTVDITWADAERGRGPTGTAIRTGRPSVNRDVLANPDYVPWRDEAIRRGYASSIALPLIADGQTLGALNIYAVQPDAFDAQEVKLLTELANDLAYAVMALRTRAERQEATGALRESEERYRLLVEMSPFAIGVHQDGKIAFLNTAGARLLGAETPQELIDKPVSEIVHPEGWEAARDRIRRMRAGETDLYPVEDRYVRLDGTVVPVEVTAAPLVYNGRPAIQVIALDITRRWRALEALQESQRTLSTLMNNLPGMAYRCRNDRNWTMEFVSEGCVALTGYQPADLVESRTIAYGDLVHPEDQATVWETVQSAVQQDRSFGLSYRIRTAGGEERWVWEQGSGISSPHGELLAMEGFITDVTERKQAEEALQQHSERLRTLHAIDGAILAAWSAEKIAQAALRHLRRSVPYWHASVILLGPESQEGTLVAVHVDGETKVSARTRVSLDEIGNRDQFEHGLVQVIEDIVDLVATAQRQGSQLPPWVQSLHAEGLRSYVAVPLIAQGELIGLLNLGMDTRGAFIPEHVDIAREVADQVAVGLHQARLREQVQRHVVELEQRVAERTSELSAANLELARASSLKDEFLANMSHELRTPLNAILGISEMLQEQIYGPLNDRQLESLRTLETSGHHLLSLINDILDVSKIEAGKAELEIGLVPVDSLCRASLSLTRQVVLEKQLKLSSSLDSAVTTVQGDERRLKQVLVNLLSNAVKFTPQGGEIGLEVVGDAEGEVVHFTVWDTGIGISGDGVARLFQPFVQLDSSLSREYAGTGLGLVLVRRIAEMHGGGVSVESEPGKGSRFTVSLPWRPVDEGGWERAEDESGQGTGQEAEPPMPGLQPSATVLLVDDNESTINTISDYLLARGYRVLVARNGIEGVDRAREERPDVILMDVQMPRMDGLEATRRIRADADLRDIPIIALTALAMPGDRERCLAAGANVYLSKPVSLKELAGVIEMRVNRDGVVE